MDFNDLAAHIIQTTTSETGGDGVTKFVRECPCGWWTIAEDPEPDHHTPLAEREAGHLDEVAAIVDRSVWSRVPHNYRLVLSMQHWGPSGRIVRYVVSTAVWSGGSQTVGVWPRDPDGLEQAQETVDHLNANGDPVVWGDGAAREGWPVEPGELSRYAH